MSLFANRSTMVLPLTVTQFASKSLSTASSRASTYRHRESSNIFRKVLSIRCVSVTCAVLFIILASAVISSTGYLTQRNLRSSQMYTQQQGVSLVSQLQINEILGYVDDSIAMLVPFVATHSMKPSVPPSEFELPHKAAYVEFINKLSAPRQETFFLMAYIWPTGKFLATEVIGGQWLIFESIIYNSTFSVYNVFPSIGPTTNVSAVDYTRPILRIPFEGDVGASLAGSHCNSSGSWLLTTLPGNPQTTLCKSVNDCDNGALSGVMLTVKTMLNQVLVVIGAPDAMAYIMEDNGDLVATSTGASPFDTVTGKRVNVNTTDLPWIAASAASYRRDPAGVTTMNYKGVDYRMQGSAVKDHNNLEWIIVVMLPLPQDNYLRNSALICAGVCVCASILFVLIILYLTRSLFELSEELEKVSRLELDLNHLSEPPFLEASKLYKSFLMMHAALSSFSKYVPKEIIGHILTSRKEAVPYLKAATTTVYFQDIKGFTSLAEKLDPEVLATITAEYMEAMSSVIIEHGGVIDKYIGDCIMALFNLPSHLEEHENAACHAATECAQLLKRLNKRWKSFYNLELEQRIGINSGEVLAGNIGSSQRLAFTCIGDNVNLASRVENINKYYGTSILITESTWQKIDHEIFSSRKISTVKVEGKNIETSLYEITKESKPEKKELFKMYEDALSCKYVPKEIIGHILTSRKEAVPYLKAATTTVYFQDIKGFTSLAEKLDPEVLATITAEYMEAMSSVIIEHGGVIDKYIGDCIMALFNLPSHLEEHENAACHAATECAQLLKRLNKRWKSFYNLELEQRIGINSGEVLAGNIGSSQRLAFTCIGDNVNLASRVENINKYYGTSILITESTWQKIDHEIFSSRKISTVKVEGKNIETSLYEITKESKPEKKELFKMYEDALSWYDSNQLEAAKSSLDKLLQKHPKDMPSLHLMQRIEKSMAGDKFFQSRKNTKASRTKSVRTKHGSSPVPAVLAQQHPVMGLFSNRNSAVLPLTVTEHTTKRSLSRTSSRASTHRQRESSNIFRKFLSIRCVSVTCTVLFIILASTMISITGYLTQKDLRSSQLSTQQQGVNLVSQLQINEVLGYVDDSLSMLIPFVTSHSMVPAVPPSQFEMPHKTAFMNFINHMSQPRENTFFLTAYIWPSGKGQWFLCESLVYNSSYTVFFVFSGTGPNMNVSSVDFNSPIFTIPFEGNMGSSLGASAEIDCNSTGTWSLTLLPGNPQTTFCKKVNDCDRGILSGIMLACISTEIVETMLSDILSNIGAPNAMAYIMEENGDLVATSTKASPYNVITGERVNVKTTNLTWITTSSASYRDNPLSVTTLNYNGKFHYSGQEEWSDSISGIDYRTQGSIVKEHNNLNWIIVVMLPLPQDNYLRNSALICAGVCICASFLFVLIILYLTRSLFELSEELEKVSRLELDLNHLSEPPFLEASKLYKSFVMMHAALSSFSKYVPKEIISHILKSRVRALMRQRAIIDQFVQKEAIPYLKAANTTIYFQDIKGFTSLAETVDPEILADVTAEYMEAMTSIIIDHGGVIDKYIGDCIMALFNLPSSLKEHENAACHAATECAQLLKQLNKRWKSLYDFELEQRIGINSGEVLAGNIGSSQRLAFTCIGDNVNLASRVENINKYYGTSILITESTWQKIDHEIFSSRKISTVKVEGKNIETSLYEITKESKPEKKELFKMYEDALSWYDSNQLQAAKSSLDQLLQKYPKDMPSLHLMKRIDKSLVGEWDRVEMVAK
ncbi:hypothetical protein PROFUN_09771 [Planoprotostelium fungivorum]|uniref:Guanylate cyclase domain-containing protein n=1 Tax=Planoprotostelium fungivorum TaxID=1890364 RepID=A0A2P6NFC0_9EUKA|nr:hypothetical protein PROFUN_09771 [Planoprotostelium fungivorum]